MNTLIINLNLFTKILLIIAIILLLLMILGCIIGGLKMLIYYWLPSFADEKNKIVKILLILCTPLVFIYAFFAILFTIYFKPFVMTKEDFK